MQLTDLGHGAGSGRLVAVVASIGEEAMSVLDSAVRQLGLRAAAFSAIGGFERVTLGYFDWATKRYEEIPIDEQVEVVAFSGNIAHVERGDMKVHAHVVVSDRTGSTRAGHLMSGIVRPTLEVMIEESPAELVRRHDPQSGLALLDLGSSSQQPFRSGAGRCRWVIAEGWIPGWSHGPEPELTSHETACMVNTGDLDAHVAITVYFNDREPAGPYHVVVPARRTVHCRFNDLTDPEPVPQATNYASLIESDSPIVVQHTRLDSRQAENALMTTIAFPG